MKHLRQRIRKIWETRPRPLRKLWRWAHAPEALARTMQRWRALKEWAREHARIAGERVYVVRSGRDLTVLGEVG